jgi:hypothetical protein
MSSDRVTLSAADLLQSTCRWKWLSRFQQYVEMTKVPLRFMNLPQHPGHSFN